MASAKSSELNFDLLTWETLKDHLKETIQFKRNHLNDRWENLLDRRVNRVNRELAKTTTTVDNYMKWQRARGKNVKAAPRTIPASILGPKINDGEIIDIRVSCRGPDDKLYDRDEELRKRLPRGCTLIECKLKDESKSRIDFALFALRKFSGGLGDDDDREDDNQAWLRYFLRHPQTATQIICTKKVNGEACHLSCLCLPSDNRLVLIAGSKNVHICFRSHSDISLYGNDSTFNYASAFCHTILDMLAEMPDHGSKLLNFLALTRYTAVFEILSYDHQHVVNLSYLKEKNHRAELKFITFSQVPEDFDSAVTNLCALPPDLSIEIGRALFLSPTDYDIIENQPTILNDYLTSIKYRYECEGSVLYFLDENDQVIGLLKKKTIWYVVLRAIREKARPMLSNWEKSHKMDLAETIERISKRLNAIQKWLRFNDAILNQWKLLAGQFLTYIADGGKKKTILRDDVANNYPILWSKFLQSNNIDDDFMRKIMEKEKDGEGEDIWKQLNEMKIESRRDKPQSHHHNRARKTKQPSDLELEEDLNINLDNDNDNDDGDDDNNEEQ